MSHWLKNKVCRAPHFIPSMRLCCLLLDSLRLSYSFAFHLLSHLPFHSPDHLHLPCGGQEPCALLLMRSQALCPRTILSEVMSPTTSTSQRLLIYSSRSPPATAIPQICMIWNSMSAPSAWRSLYHCSPRSEKMQRTVDKLITLLTKVCRQVSRRPSVMLDQGNLFSDHKFQTSEKIRVATQRMSKSGFFWNDRKRRFSLIVEQRFRNTSSRSIMIEEVSKS